MICQTRFVKKEKAITLGIEPLKEEDRAESEPCFFLLQKKHGCSRIAIFCLRIDLSCANERSRMHLAAQKILWVRIYFIMVKSDVMSEDVTLKISPCQLK